MDFVTYSFAGTAWAVRKEPGGITVDNACGHVVAVQDGSTQADDAQRRSAACMKAGRKPITVRQYQLQNQAVSAVVSGKDDAWLSDLQVVSWAATQPGQQLQLVGKPYDTAPLGIAVPKKQGQFTEVVRRAVQSLIDDDTYRTSCSVGAPRPAWSAKRRSTERSTDSKNQAIRGYLGSAG